MKSYKSRQLPNLEPEKDYINKESSKKIILNSEKIKDITTTPSRVPSCISTSQEYQIDNNKLPKSKSSQKKTKPNNNYIIFKNYINNKKEFAIQKRPKDLKSNVKKTLSADKIGKNNINLNSNRFINDKKNFIENNLSKKEIVKNEMNEIIKDFIDNNLKNNKNCNFFRLFKMKRKNQNNSNKEEIFPPLYGNAHPLETEQNEIYKNKKENKYINLLTKQNEEDNNTIHYRDALINSVNKKKLKENRIFIKIDEHFNKLNNDNSPKKIIYQGEMGRVKNSNQNYLINKSANSKNIKNLTNNINNEIQPIYKSLAYEKYLDKKDCSKTPNYAEKINYLNQKKNRIKIKLNTPKNNNVFAKNEEFNILIGKVNLNRKKTPNIFINNNVTQTKNTSNNKNKINNCQGNNKIKNKRIENVDDNVLGDSFRDELNILISGVNNCSKEKNKKEIQIKEKNQDYSIESDEEVKLNLNCNDESIEKVIPKEHEERINLIKKFNRPETSYGRQKNNIKKL